MKNETESSGEQPSSSNTSSEEASSQKDEPVGDSDEPEAHDEL